MQKQTCSFAATLIPDKHMKRIEAPNDNPSKANGNSKIIKVGSIRYLKQEYYPRLIYPAPYQLPNWGKDGKPGIIAQEIIIM